MNKRIGYAILLGIMLVALGYGFSPAPKALAAANPAPAAEEIATYVPGQLMVELAPSVSLGSVASRAGEVARSIGAKVLKTDGQSLVLLDVGKQRNLEALQLTLKRIKGVRNAEPNYIYKATGPAAAVDLQASQAAIPLQASLSSSYPNDAYLLDNAGWRWVGADIVWKNTSPSKTICLLSSGVDYKHKDLTGKVIKGPDYVNDDTDPMDDFGQGTHLAGIIAAVANNKEGIAGVSTGKVLVVKVLDASGEGTAYDVIQGINYCASQSSVSILDVGWAGPYSNTLKTAVQAASDKGKLIVAAAGDHNTTSMTNVYPAGFTTAPVIITGVMAVAASGYESGSGTAYNSKTNFSNYGSWITITAPGGHIYSTTPWDKPSVFNDYYHVGSRYGYFTGTPEASAFVAAAAARTWGYLPADTAAQIVTRLQSTGDNLTLAACCWDPVTMIGKKSVNLARAMDRGAVQITVRDALSNLPIPGAKVTVYASAGGATIGSATIPSTPTLDPLTVDAVDYPDFVDILNVPTTSISTLFTAKVTATGYTASAQNAFVGDSHITSADGEFGVPPGGYRSLLSAHIPPKSANFAVIGDSVILNYTIFLAAWVPKDSLHFIVSPYYYIHPPSLVTPYGSLLTDPYARWMKNDGLHYEALVIHNRPANKALPFYGGTYQIGITDNNDGGTNYMDGNNVSVFIWKDGVIKSRVDKGSTTCDSGHHWWFPVQITSSATGSPTYTLNTPSTTVPNCGIWSQSPYQN